MDDAVPTLAETVEHEGNTQDPQTTASEERLVADTPGAAVAETLPDSCDDDDRTATFAPSGSGRDSITADGSTSGDTVTPAWSCRATRSSASWDAAVWAWSTWHARSASAPCAMKIILAGHHAGSAATARFLSEAETVAKFDHPTSSRSTISATTTVGLISRSNTCDGGSLARKLEARPGLPNARPLWSKRCARAIARGTSPGDRPSRPQAGQHPAGADGTPKIGDFGLAKSIGSDADLTQSGVIMGSPSYMSPEQAEGNAKRIGPAADLYALGAILYELLTGRPAVPGRDRLCRPCIRSKRPNRCPRPAGARLASRHRDDRAQMPPERPCPTV